MADTRALAEQPAAASMNEFSSELRRLSSTLDRVDEVGEVCTFVECLFTGKSRAGVLLLCGGAEHAIPDLALRLAHLDHDPLLLPTNPLESKAIRPAGSALKPFMVRDRLEDDLAEWIESQVGDTDGRALEKALHAASHEGDLWILTFRITGSRSNQVSRVEYHVAAFADLFDRIGQTGARAWGPARFLIIYCVECEKNQAELLSKRQAGFRLQPVRVLCEWLPVSGGDIDEWFDLVAREFGSKPALRAVDLEAVRLGVHSALYEDDATRSVPLNSAIRTLRRCLSAGVATDVQQAETTR